MIKTLKMSTDNPIKVFPNSIIIMVRIKNVDRLLSSIILLCFIYINIYLVIQKSICIYKYIFIYIY